MRGFLSVVTGLGGIIAVILGCILIIIFYPIIVQEVGYDISHMRTGISSHQNLVMQEPQITPVDTNFGIVIPKINANSKIIANVDPYNVDVYQKALRLGIAHVKESSLPDGDGNVFLFSHSSGYFYEIQNYNSVFYLLYKLENGDTIDLYYNGDKYIYTVTDKKIVSPASITYLNKVNNNKSLTLMSSWPPGTFFQRLLILAQPADTLQ